MTIPTTYPKIRSVKAMHNKTLLVTFKNGSQKVYDCTPLLQSTAFRPLQEEALFRSAYVDSHGYGIVWNDNIDLAESEIWINGRIKEPKA